MVSNILHISRTMGIGGAEKIVLQLSTAFLEDFGSTFVASTGGEYEKDLKENSINHIKINDIENKSIKSIKETYKTLKKVVLENEIDIIHVHHRMGLLYAKLLKLSKKDIRIVYTAHNNFTDKKYLYSLLLKNIEIVAVGESVKKSLIELNKVTSHIDVINNCVPLTKKSNFKFSFEGTKVLVVSRITEVKGIDYIINSVEYINSPNVKLFIVGDGDQYSILKEKVESNPKLSEKIEMLGFKKNPSEYIQACDFMLTASLMEGLPLVPIECIMSGKTMIATNIPGNNEIINNENGILINVKSSKEIAQAIDYLIDNPEEVKEKEKQSLNTYNSKFSFEKFIELYRDIYFKEKI